MHITNSSTGLRNVCTFPAKIRSKVANITTRGELGVMFQRGIMNSQIKGLILGLFIAIGLGVIGYIITVLYLSISMNIQNSKELVDIIRSKQVMYWSLPYSLFSLAFANWVATKKLSGKHYYIGLAIILITSASITFGPLKIITIHINYIPIVLGGLLGAYIGKKHNKCI